MRRMMAPNTSSACARAERRDDRAALWRKNFDGAIGTTVADWLDPVRVAMLVDKRDAHFDRRSEWTLRQTRYASTHGAASLRCSR